MLPGLLLVAARNGSAPLPPAAFRRRLSLASIGLRFARHRGRRLRCRHFDDAFARSFPFPGAVIPGFGQVRAFALLVAHRLGGVLRAFRIGAVTGGFGVPAFLIVFVAVAIPRIGQQYGCVASGKRI